MSSRYVAAMVRVTIVTPFRAWGLTFVTPCVNVRHLMAPGYRPPSADPKGRWARHIHAARRERGWNQTRAFEEWHVGLGLAPKSRTAYLNLDMGKRQPKPHEAEYLASQIGWPPDQDEPVEAPPSDMAALIAAIRDQTRAMDALVNELRADHAVSADVRERVAAIEAYRDEHERRLQADLLRGIGPVADSPLRSPQPAAGR